MIPGKKQNWRTAFGLQDVDNLKPSEYAVRLSEEHVAGKMDIYQVENENNAKFFRNALVRANYRNVVLGVNRENKFLLRFFENILQGKNNNLQNRELHILWKPLS